MDEEKRKEEILRYFTECGACDLKIPNERHEEGLELADKYMKILPGADYVLTQTLNYIFSNGLTTGSIVQDEELDKFLYRENIRGTINLHEIRNAIGMAITHGHSGLRWIDGNVYQYKWGEYRALTVLQNGIKRVAGYLVSKDASKVPPLKFDYESYRDYEDFLREIDENRLILLSPKDFQNIRNDTSKTYGSSPLLADRDRLDLLVAVYERLNYDIRYDGPGRIIIRPKEGYAQGGETDISTTEAIKGSLESQDKQIKALKKEIKRVADEIKTAGSDAVIVLSNAFDEHIEKLERVTKATEFFNWIKSDTMMLAQDFGMSPSLLELGGVSGNVSMTSIINTAMINSIVPLRERYAVQISSFLGDHLGVGKVFFNKYEMEQAEDQNTMRTKVVNQLSLLNSMTDENGVIRPEALELFKNFSQMLEENIHNELNLLEEL